MSASPRTGPSADTSPTVVDDPDDAFGDGPVDEPDDTADIASLRSAWAAADGVDA